jgi:membrane protease YdiL (CAAX protease family)
VLTAVGILGAFVVIPHLLEHLAQFLATGLIVAIAATAGAWFASRTGLATPIIDAALTRQTFPRRVPSTVALAIALGVIASLAIVALDVLVFAPLAPETKAIATPPLWTGAFAALYGGLTEEIVLRYGAMSLLAWLCMKLLSGRAAYSAAIVGASLLFGLAHLPATAAVLSLTPVLITRTILLNGLAGLAFGWLYWRRGLEAAMVSHGVAALILHVTVPAIGV